MLLHIAAFNVHVILLEKDKSVAIHTRNLQYLASEMFNVKIGMLSAIMVEIFEFCDNATHSRRVANSRMQAL